MQAAVEAGSGRQPGNPVHAVAAIRKLVTAAEPPLRLQLGSDCVGLVENKPTSVANELDQWHVLAAVHRLLIRLAGPAGDCPVRPAIRR
jgi:hypothetical protein